MDYMSVLILHQDKRNNIQKSKDSIQVTIFKKYTPPEFEFKLYLIMWRKYKGLCYDCLLRKDQSSSKYLRGYTIRYMV
ncbi:unnamed protein product [Paramecium primaurelia]|uniref:Uncharacterized protein n=1 Tax=Paramecium primaurelia TaxID=5886 RepID=A0A8S1KZC7_PARPR|nr:unnamed protein product [Paramecium primaurelia]